MSGRQWVIITAIVCITLLEIVALIKGIDGQLMSLVIGAIATLVGYLFGKTRE